MHGCTIIVCENETSVEMQGYSMLPYVKYGTIEPIVWFLSSIAEVVLGHYMKPILSLSSMPISPLSGIE